LLIEVSELEDTTGIGIPRVEIWLLRAGETTPRPLLKSEHYSFQAPSWSHHGEWIAYHQRDLGSGRYQVGVIRPDGTGQRLALAEEFGATSRLFWSWDDRRLIFEAASEVGNRAYVVDIETGVARQLNPNPEAHYSRIWLLPSPTADVTFLAGLIAEAPAPKMEMWMVPLNEGGEVVRVPPKVWTGCAALLSIDWAPTGQILLVRPGTAALESSPDGQPILAFPEPCTPPRLWGYDLASQSWAELAKPPNDGPRYSDLRWVDWSPDGRWAAWKTIEGALIYEVGTWTIVREIELGANQGFLPWSWMRDTAGNSIYTAYEHDYAQPPESYTLLGFSPNGAQQEDRVLAEVLRDPDWLSGDGRFIDYFPLSWQP
jgi:hypothetical protein